MSAHLIAIEGLDGSGKETQTKLLRAALESRGLKVGSVSFPRYGQPSAAPVEQYLAGGYGERTTDVNAYAASSLFAVDRLASYPGEWRGELEECDYFIADRYTTSNAIHQLSKLPEAKWGASRNGCSTSSSARSACPGPMRSCASGSTPLRASGCSRGATGGDSSKRDVHERDLGYLERSRRAADWSAARFGWLTVECARNGHLRERMDVHSEIMGRLGL